MLELQTEAPVIEKTKELCQTLVDQPEFKKILEDVDAFLADPEAQGIFENLRNKQDMLMHNQQNGETISEEEIADFEKDRDTLMNHPVAGTFVEAQNQMQELQSKIMTYVSKTFELGRVPTEDDLLAGGGGCCGGSGGGDDGGGCCGG